MAATLLCGVALSALLVQGDPSRKLVDMYVSNGIVELGLDPASREGRERIARLTEGVRDELQDRALVYDEARRRGLPIDERLPASRARWIAKLGGERGYRAYLAEHRLGDAEFQRVIEYEIAGELLREELTREVLVSDAEVIAFYEAGRTDPKLEALFVAPATVTAGHILVAARPGLHSDLEERRARAERIRQKIVAGGDFAAVARQYSEDPGTRARGGDLGTRRLLARHQGAQHVLVGERAEELERRLCGGHANILVRTLA